MRPSAMRTPPSSTSSSSMSGRALMIATRRPDPGRRLSTVTCPLLLTVPAPARDALVRRDLADVQPAPRTAAFVLIRAGLRPLPVDLEVLPPLLVVEFVAEVLAQDRDAAVEGLVDRAVQASDVIVVHGAALAERIQPRLEQDLVRVRVSDSGDELVVGKDVLDLP